MADPHASGPLRLAVIAGAWLALFALLFTVGASFGVWPQLPPGALRGTDLVAGAAAALVVLVLLARALWRGRE